MIQGKEVELWTEKDNDVLSSLPPDSSHLYFSSLHIVQGLTSQLPLTIYRQCLYSNNVNIVCIYIYRYVNTSFLLWKCRQFNCFENVLLPLRGSVSAHGQCSNVSRFRMSWVSKDESLNLWVSKNARFLMPHRNVWQWQLGLIDRRSSAPG